jgi:hypothetical protein
MTHVLAFFPFFVPNVVVAMITVVVLLIIVMFLGDHRHA